MLALHWMLILLLHLIIFLFLAAVVFSFIVAAALKKTSFEKQYRQELAINY